jgi:hypothetical protein
VLVAAVVVALDAAGFVVGAVDFAVLEQAAKIAAADSKATLATVARRVPRL